MREGKIVSKERNVQMKALKSAFIKTIVVLGIVAVFAGCTPISQRVGDILAKMPAEDATEGAKLTAELVELGPTGIGQICKMLVPPGTGDDTKARYALSGLTMYVCRPGAETERKMYAKTFTKALESAADKEVKAFLVRQLQLVGKEETRDSSLVTCRSCHETEAVSLFNGTDLTGWKRHEGLPGDDEPTGKWTVEDGAIVGVQDPPGKGGFLTTLQKFRDFELQLETKIDWPFDSGVFLRVGQDGKSHQVTLDYRPDGQIGRIYCPWTHAVVHECPEGIKHFKAGQWNRIKIVCTGEPARIRFWLNDNLVTDFQHTEATTSGIPQEGTIALQIHPGGEGYDKASARFRNILIRQIRRKADVGALSEQEKADGFVPLFNGTDLNNWTGATNAYFVEDGKIACRKHTKGNLYTQKQYGNFVLRFEFKLTPGANNGLGIRAPLEGDAAYVGMEIQIIDNTADKYKNLKPYQYHGSIYGVVPARRGFLKPLGQWNCEEVIAKGPRITVNLNGTTIVDADIEKAGTPQTMDAKDHPGLKRAKGHIGFLGHGDYVEFRNIRIKKLR